MKQRSVAFTALQWDELDAEAGRIGITVSEYLRRLLDAAREVRAALVARRPIA